MTLVPPQNTAEQEHCQEQEVPIIQIIMGVSGGKMMTYSFLQSRHECHHFIPFEGDYDRVGYSLRLQNQINFIPISSTVRRRTTVTWIECMDPNRLMLVSEEDFWEFGRYSATRFAQPDYIAVARIRNAPHEFLMTIAYTPESYNVNNDRWVLTKHIHTGEARFKLLSDNQWHVYTKTVDEPS